ncbi:MAG: hypothetical protein KF777_00230 [Planctomycetaceae bacterium]|nr:hypothetical protein [Planctomycetaceae bacterium]
MSQTRSLFDPACDQTDDVDALAVLTTAPNPAEIVTRWLQTARQDQISDVWSAADALLATVQKKGGWR